MKHAQIRLFHKGLNILRLLKERRAATALMWALMLPTMILAVGAGVDFARISASRAQLQAAADQAALAGVGAYANEINASNGNGVATAAFNAAYAGISGAVSLQNGPNISIGCTGSDATVCGSSGSFTESKTACSTGTYCVTVSATARQTNSIFHMHLPFEDISVSATAQLVSGNAGSTPGQSSNFADFAQSYYSGGYGGSEMLGSHTSGIGAGSAYSGGSSSGNAYFLDSINNTAPTSLSYNALPGQNNYGCSSSGNFSADMKGVYNVPANSSYCGSITFGTGQTEQLYNINGTANSGSWIAVNNNLTISPRTVVCPENLGYSNYTGAHVSISTTCATGSYANANYTPIYLGGSLILNYSVNVTPSTANNGMITFVNDEYDNVQMLDSNANTQEYAVVCPGGATSCSNPYAGKALYFSGPGTLISHDTYVTTITVQNGYNVAWTEQETFAVKFTPTCSGYGWRQQCGSSNTNYSNNDQAYEATEIATVGGGYTSSHNATTTVKSIPSPTSSYSPSVLTRDPNSDTTGIGSTNDAYGQLDKACAAAAKTNSIGGNQSVGGTIAPLKNITGLTDIFAMTTDAPPSSSPPIAYNFTAPNYGYSYVNPDEQGSALETETAYFCGNGSDLSVSNGSASGLSVTPTSSTGAVLTN